MVQAPNPPPPPPQGHGFGDAEPEAGNIYIVMCFFSLILFGVNLHCVCTARSCLIHPKASRVRQWPLGSLDFWKRMEAWRTRQLYQKIALETSSGTFLTGSLLISCKVFRWTGRRPCKSNWSHQLIVSPLQLFGFFLSFSLPRPNLVDRIHRDLDLLMGSLAGGHLLQPPLGS